MTLVELMVGLAVGLFVSTLPRSGTVRWQAVLAGLSVVGLCGLSFIFGPKFAAGHPLVGVESFALVALLYGVLVHLSAGGNRWSMLQIPGARLTSDLAYGIYLTHMLVIEYFMKVRPGAYSWLLLTAIVIGCYAVALALRYSVEVPFLKLRDNFALFRKSRAASRSQDRSTTA